MTSSKPSRLAVRAAIVLLLSLCGMHAQSVRLDSMVRGFVHQPATKTVRPVIGIPGAAFVGGVIIGDADFASISPLGTWGVATHGGITSVVRVENYSSVSDVQELASAEISRAAWSRDGLRVTFYSAQGHQLQTVSFRDGGIQTGDAVDLSALGGELSALTITNAGVAVFAMTGSGGGGIYMIEAGQPVLLAAAAEPSALALSPTEDTLYVADRTRQTLLQLRGLVPGEPLETAAISDAVGVAVSNDGRRVYAASATDRKLYVYAADSGQTLAEMELDRAPRMLQPFSTDSVYLLNPLDKEQGSLIVLDAREQPAVFFIPAGELN